LRHQKALHSCSDDLPPSTSEDNSEYNKTSKPRNTDQILSKKSAKLSGSNDGDGDHQIGPVSAPERFAMTQLVRTDSQTSIESVRDIVREKEEKWRQRHQSSSVKRKVRIQTLI
jgi:hypothetical protein